MKEANNEYTFVTANGNEFMVWFDDNGQPERIYTYSDSMVDGLSLEGWKSKDNSLFIHCPESGLMTAWDYLDNNAYCSELEG